MPDRRLHLKFDEYLRNKGIIHGYTYGYMVHDRMDRNAHKIGHWKHREWDYYHSEEGIRDWLGRWEHLAYQETLTDYIRIALGHIVLDEIWSRRGYEFESEDELIKSAYRSFIARGYHRKFYRSRK